MFVKAPGCMYVMTLLLRLNENNIERPEKAPNDRIDIILSDSVLWIKRVSERTIKWSHAHPPFSQQSTNSVRRLVRPWNDNVLIVVMMLEAMFSVVRLTHVVKNAMDAGSIWSKPLRVRILSIRRQWWWWRLHKTFHTFEWCQTAWTSSLLYWHSLCFRSWRRGQCQLQTKQSTTTPRKLIAPLNRYHIIQRILTLRVACTGHDDDDE